MCGILGHISLKGDLKFEKNKFLKCLSYLTHRGPNDEGYKVYPRAIFGHKRLSIMDLSRRGNQPMVSKDGNYTITFNGEIYNFKELKKNLIKKNYNFTSKTDTEILMNGLIEEGPDFIKRCNGMFAFSFYDRKKDITLIFRDRIGIKPLYYSIYKNKLTFSSNIKPIFDYNGIKKKINLQSVSSYFSFRQPINNETFFNNIYSLEPGHFIQIKNKKIQIKKYWNLESFFSKNKKDLGENYYKKKLTQLLKSSIKYRLISDVKVASLLSGGLDSSIISSIINSLIGKNFLAFSIGYSNKGYNEFDYSKLIAQKLNMRHKIFKSNSESYFKNMKELISIRNHPLTIPNEVSQYELCKKIKKHATVVLSGCGADELFCGYGRIFSSVDDYKKIKNHKYIKLKKNFLKNVKFRYGKINFKNYLDHFLSIYPYTELKLKKKILHKKFNHNKIEKNIESSFKNIFNKVKINDYSEKMQYFFQTFHLKGILEREDISSMAASTELRVPFLDHRIIEFAATIPLKYKIKTIKKSEELTSDKTSEINDITKFILRKSFNSKIPKSILTRKKIGFPIPLHDWLKKKKIRNEIKKILLSKSCKERGIFDNDYLRKLLSEINDHKFLGDSRIYQSSIATKIWMCFNLEIFFQNHK